MSTQLNVDHLSTFQVQTWPLPSELGRALERNARMPGARLQLRFDQQVASLAVSDIWSTCCELLLQAQLAREANLDRFVVDVEHIFDLGYEAGSILCVFSKEHVFAVDRECFAAALERAVAEIFQATSCPRLMQIAASWAASNIRSQPYAYRFSDSVLT
jgi:hypothetical protein